MVTLSAVERLNDRIKDYLGTGQQRIQGSLCLSPILSDGSRTLVAGNIHYALSPDQSNQYDARFYPGVLMPKTGIPPSPGRIPMSDDAFAEFCTYVERHRQR